MIREPVVASAFVALATLTAAGAASAQARAEPLALTNAHVVDVGTGKVSPGMTVVLRDGRIAAVASAAPAGMRTVSASRS